MTQAKGIESDTSPDQWSAIEIELIRQLRDEAEEMKQCFTRFSFQSMAVSATVLAASIGVMGEYEAARYIPLPMIILLFTVCRIGIYKYASANRNYGYELHLSRTRHQTALGVDTPTGVSWDPKFRAITWEEACRAWRIVQPTIFRRLYRVPQDYRGRIWGIRTLRSFYNEYLAKRYYQYRNETARLIESYIESSSMHSERSDEYPWFSPVSLVQRIERLEDRTRAGTGAEPSRVSYVAGSYLRVMMGLLSAMQGLMLVPLCLSITKRVVLPVLNPNAAMSVHGIGSRLATVVSQHWTSVIDIVIVIAVSFVVWRRYVRITNRRQILEDGLLSIHSCAITWQAVVVAHFRAVRKTGNTYWHYTEALARQAVSAADHVYSIHAWITTHEHEEPA